MRVEIRRFELPLKRPFGLSRGTTKSRTTIVVGLRSGDLAGYGEATTHEYYGVDEASLIETIAAFARLVLFLPPGPPEELSEALEKSIVRDAPEADRNVRRFALCAVDEALHDLWGKLRGSRTYALWGGDLAKAPRSNYTIALDDVRAMIDNLREHPGWPCYKIKLGREDDLAILEALRAETDAPFRVDANAGWSFETACQRAGELPRFDVELIEQPLAVSEDHRVVELAAISPLPLFADESCVTVADVERCADSGFAGVNLKLVKCGGLTPARRLIAAARKRDLAVMAGCMTESSVGISALAQLLPWLDYVDLDGACLIDRDPATGVVVDRGTANFPDRCGNGVELNDPEAGLVATFEK